MERFQNRAVSITGADSGIGAATVRRLFAEGAHIAASDIRREAVDEVVAEFGIRANAIAPGMIGTPMTAALFADPENVKRIRAGRVRLGDRGGNRVPVVRRREFRDWRCPAR